MTGVQGGELADGTVAELLQTLAAAQATGALHVRPAAAPAVAHSGPTDGYQPDPGDAVIYLQDGAVYSAAAPGPRPLLGVRLIAAQVLTPQALGAALDSQAGPLSGWRLGDLLVHLGYVDADVVAAFARELTLDAVTRVCGWPAGSWQFRRGERTPDSARPEPVDRLLVSVRHRERHSALLTELVGAADEVPVAVTDEAAVMDPITAALIHAMDGHLTLEEIALRCGLTGYEASCRLAPLVEAGQVRGRAAAPHPAVPAGLTGEPTAHPGGLFGAQPSPVGTGEPAGWGGSFGLTAGPADREAPAGAEQAGDDMLGGTAGGGEPEGAPGGLAGQSGDFVGQPGGAPEPDLPGALPDGPGPVPEEEPVGVAGIGLAPAEAQWHPAAEAGYSANGYHAAAEAGYTAAGYGTPAEPGYDTAGTGAAGIGTTGEPGPPAEVAWSGPAWPAPEAVPDGVTQTGAVQTGAVQTGAMPAGVGQSGDPAAGDDDLFMLAAMAREVEEARFAHEAASFARFIPPSQPAQAPALPAMFETPDPHREPAPGTPGASFEPAADPVPSGAGEPPVTGHGPEGLPSPGGLAADVAPAEAPAGPPVADRPTFPVPPAEELRTPPLVERPAADPAPWFSEDRAMLQAALSDVATYQPGSGVREVAAPPPAEPPANDTQHRRPAEPAAPRWAEDRPGRPPADTAALLRELASLGGQGGPGGAAGRPPGGGTPPGAAAAAGGKPPAPARHTPPAGPPASPKKPPRKGLFGR